MVHTCKFCNSEFTTKSYMNYHQKNTKYCLEKQGQTDGKNFTCKYCDKKLSSEKRLKTHYNICDEYTIVNLKNEYEKKIVEKDTKISKYEEKIKQLQDKYEEKIKQLQDKLENIAIKAIQRDFEDETTIYIDDSIYQPEDSDSEDDNEEYKLTPLEVGQGFTIEHREEDGYINVTNLCKAGGKQFKAWNRLEKTKAFIQVLSSSVLISTVALIKHNTGGNGERHTWVHPQLAINIAQWISRQFDVKVSGWVYEIMMTGKVDITNTTSFKQLQKDNKDKQLKIQYLTKKYVKAQTRVQYEERNVVYILTTKRMKKDRIYILGKATNLTNRLSTYNKSDEHEVVYYASCGDENTMNCVEKTIFQYLKSYRQQANRERFVLPENEEIELFSNIIKKSVEFFKK